MAGAKGISHTLLIATEAFGERLSAQRVAGAIGRGVIEVGLPEPDLCPLESADDAKALEAIGFDGRMKAARALVLAVSMLDEHTLLGSLAFELATRARQSGVPCYAVTSSDSIDRFDARILDLQTVIEARSERSLQAAGKRLATIA